VSRAQIETELLAWMREDSAPDEDAARFERLALAIFVFQFESCEPYQRFCASMNQTPASVDRLEAIPPVPAGAFKEFALRCFPAEATCKTFRTSGTSLDRRGELHLDTLVLYEASLLASLQRYFMLDLCGTGPEMHFLAPSGEESPDSSLTHMFEVLRREEGSPTSTFDLRDGSLDLDSLGEAIRSAQSRNEPLIVAGTSFAFVHLLDALADTKDTDRWLLPAGSRLMETGGFKGRSRVVPREELRTAIASRFGLDERAVVNQYGMTELGSQFYDSTLLDPDGPRRKLTPPWTRVRFVDPASGVDVPAGDLGQIVIHDLANTGSVAAIQTADLGRAILDSDGREIGFDVAGREVGAEARGCSIATDVMLDASMLRVES
jgi:hypothetical protein